MSIKGFHLLWIKLRFKNKRFQSISLPISLYFFQELLDCILDLLTLACFFAPKAPDQNSSSQSTLYSAKELVIILMNLMDSFSINEPYDLLDITTDEVKILINFR